MLLRPAYPLPIHLLNTDLLSIDWTRMDKPQWTQIISQENK